MRSSDSGGMWLALYAGSLCKNANGKLQTSTLPKHRRANTGMDCADARSLKSLALSDWAAGNIIHLCGNDHFNVTSSGSGAAETSSPVKGSRAHASPSPSHRDQSNGNSAYLLFDGGTPCGPGTACDAVEAANQTS